MTELNLKCKGYKRYFENFISAGGGVSLFRKEDDLLQIARIVAAETNDAVADVDRWRYKCD
jgi:hypothetical protein